jgi:hypothetical protein
MVLKPYHFIEPAPQLLEPPYPEKQRVHAGGSIKGQAKGLSFYAARPRISISLSIAQRGLIYNFMKMRIANCWAPLLEISVCGRIIFMALFTRKKLSRLVLAAYIAFSAAGVFSLMAVEVLRAVCFEVRSSEPDRIYNTESGYFIRQPAESTAFVVKTGSAYFIPLRMGFERVASLPGPQIVQNIFSKQSLTANAKVQYIKLKNTISLNLRI